MLLSKKQSYFKKFTISVDGKKCYAAGYPNYPRNFSRDILLTAIIANDYKILKNQIELNILYQGTLQNPINGEEFGKIYHEMPGVYFRDSFNTMYNACDTTALFLIGLEKLTRYNYLLKTKASYLIAAEAAVRYIESHLKDGLFWEYPPSPATKYSLRITYWKDSILPSANNHEEPDYPVAYGLVQFQNARALLAAAKLLKRPDLKILADKMFRIGIKTFITESDYVVAIDKNQQLKQNSSDEMHALAYIPKKYKKLLPLNEIQNRAYTLATPAGFACTPEDAAKFLTDNYHGYVVWVFEQVFINYGCIKFKLTEQAQVASRVKNYIEDGNELLSVKPTISYLGNNNQLWSVAAKLYFDSFILRRKLSWL